MRDGWNGFNVLHFVNGDDDGFFLLPCCFGHGHERDRDHDGRDDRFEYGYRR